MNKLDWKGVGQFVAVLVQIWTMIRVVMIETQVGLEILGWIVCDGREWFKRFLKELVAEYKKSLPSEPEKDHVIDFDSAPTIPANLTIAPDSDQIAGRVRGKRKLSDIKIRFHLDVGQTDGKYLRGYDLKAKLDGKAVLGAQLLDFYLKHPELIPEDWKTKGVICFWGSIYCGAFGGHFVRCITWQKMKWVSNYFRLDYKWYGSDPAAVLASP